MNISLFSFHLISAKVKIERKTDIFVQKMPVCQQSEAGVMPAFRRINMYDILNARSMVP